MRGSPEATRREVLKASATAVVLQQTETEDDSIGNLLDESDPTPEYGDGGYGLEGYGGGLFEPIDLPGEDLVDSARERVNNATDRVRSIRERLFGDDEPGGDGGSSSSSDSFVGELLADVRRMIAEILGADE